ncbi:MAG: ribosomal-processing cysteine protease Prp [Bacilli bacterium]|nr:ribosomal-processing cysteine protease Prp [Bacilli bacterium]
MITVNVVKENKKYKKITILGHAMYDEYGKDIVCSACSSIVTTTVNGILALDKGSLSYLVGKKGMTIDIKNEDHTTQVLINNMVRLLKDLAGKYPDNIEVK